MLALPFRHREPFSEPASQLMGAVAVSRASPDDLTRRFPARGPALLLVDDLSSRLGRFLVCITGMDGCDMRITRRREMRGGCETKRDYTEIREQLVDEFKEKDMQIQ